MNAKKHNPFQGLKQVELARKLGVSQMTISRVLNSREGVKAALREKILKEARSSGYVHDKIAAGLRGSATRSIGLIIPDITSTFFPRITAAVEKSANDAGYCIFLAQSHESYEQEQTAINLLRGFRVDGFIIAPAGSKNQTGNYRALQNLGIPFVFIDRYKKNIKASAVVTDIEKGSRQLGQYLIRNGYRKWGYLEGPRGISSSEDHKRGLKKSLAASPSGDCKMVSVTAGFEEEEGYQAAGRLLEIYKPDVIIGVNDPVAIGAYRFLRHKHIRVPRDIALAGFSDLNSADLLEVPLTTVREFTGEIGKKAFDLLLEKIRNRDAKHRIIRIEPELIIRDST